MTQTTWQDAAALCEDCGVMVQFSTDPALATLQNPIGARVRCPEDPKHRVNAEAVRQKEQVVQDAIEQRRQARPR